jgi:hypothetical protein
MSKGGQMLKKKSVMSAIRHWLDTAVNAVMRAAIALPGAGKLAHDCCHADRQPREWAYWFG